MIKSIFKRKVFRVAVLKYALAATFLAGLASCPAIAIDVSEQSDLIKHTIESWDDYWNRQELDSFLKYHLSDYKDNDGADLDKAKSNARELWKEFPDCKVKTTIKQISLSGSGDFASVEYEDELIGPTPSPRNENLGKGTLAAKSGGTLFLRNVEGAWRLARARIDWEEQTLRYGRAMEIPVSLEAALQLKPGTSYFAKLKFDSPADTRCVASIRKKLIGGPPAIDKWRAMPDCGVLEREFQTNLESKNELVCGTVGIALRENRRKIAGLAYVSRRVNVLPDAQSKKP